MAAKFSDGRFRVSRHGRHGRHGGSRVSTVLLDSREDPEPTGGFAPHYFRRLGLQIGAAYVILAAGAFAAIGFGLRSTGPGSAPLIRIPAVVFPTISASPVRTAGPRGGGAAPGATARASATPVADTVSPVAVQSDMDAAQPAVTVIYLVVAQDGGQFEGEVTVQNNGSAPISGWQIVVALPGDQITSFWNASGYVSNNILLLQPAYETDAIAPGGTLSVYFTAAGWRTAPQACAFDDTSCG